MLAAAPWLRREELAAPSGPGDPGSHAGLVTKVEVDKGTHLEEAEGLVVPESMRMENQIRAPIKVTVGEIYAREGAAFERRETLLGPTDYMTAKKGRSTLLANSF
jgi:pyruvate carboxylase